MPNKNIRAKSLNPMKQVSPILPQSSFFGKASNEDSNFARRKIPQINDVQLAENTEPEEIKNLKRMPITVMDEDNLPRLLSDETEKLNLENHYWISNGFFAKLGHLAPNLTQLSLRRMPHVSNISFAEIFGYLTKLVTADFSGCS